MDLILEFEPRCCKHNALNAISLPGVVLEYSTNAILFSNISSHVS